MLFEEQKGNLGAAGGELGGSVEWGWPGHGALRPLEAADFHATCGKKLLGVSKQQMTRWMCILGTPSGCCVGQWHTGPRAGVEGWFEGLLPLSWGETMAAWTRGSGGQRGDGFRISFVDSRPDMQSTSLQPTGMWVRKCGCGRWRLQVS